MIRSLLRLLAVLALTLGLIAVDAPSVQASEAPSQLELRPGQSASSPNGQYRLIHQHDGNVVLYNATKALWATNTHGRDTSHLLFQPDGNFVLYGEGSVLWATGTHDKGETIAVQDDGNLVIYSSTKAVWAIKGMEPAYSVDGAITMYFGPASTRLGAEARRVVACESGGNPNAVSRTNDHGIFQINKPSHYSAFPRVTGSPFYNGIYNPYENAQYARYLYDDRNGWGHWTCKP